LSVGLDKNMKQTAQKEKQYTKNKNNKKTQNTKNIKQKHKTKTNKRRVFKKFSNYKITKRSK